MKAQAVYEYTDPDGYVIARKLRIPDVVSGGKTFVWEHPTGVSPDGNLLWSRGIGPGKPGLYRATAVAEEANDFGVVWVCEGEKDADAMAAAGYVATSVPNGAGNGSGKWSDAWASVLAGARHVIVVADDDVEGRAHAARVALALLRLLPHSVGLVLPAPGCKDAAEHLAAGNGRADWRRQSQADAEAWAGARPEPASAESATGSASEGSVDVDRLLGQAWARVSSHGRNDSGFWLALQLRDAGLTEREARKIVTEKYAPAANALGTKKGDPYTAREAKESVRQAFKRDARDPNPAVVHGFRTTDAGNAQRFAAQHGEDVRFNSEWNHWLVWDGSRWGKDRTLGVQQRAKETAESIYSEAAAAADQDSRARLAKWAVTSEKRSSIESMIVLARSEVAVTADQLDADPWLLNCANGALDLKTGELLPQTKELMVTKVSPVAYNPDAKAARWEPFLRIVLPDPEMREFVQKAVGYSLTGDTREQALFITYGSGQNGKSTFLEAVRNVVGEYAQNAPTEMLLNKKTGGGIPNDVARLRGARYVTAIETAKGRRMEETLVKQLTGGDTVTARFMRAEFFEFTPVAKIWMATNHKPIITGTDEGIWRRIRLIPFIVKIPPEDLDPTLPAALQAEAPGILAWAVRGALAWQREGLDPPTAVVEATGKYREDMDVLGNFLRENCRVAEDAVGVRASLFAAYENWCHENNLRAPSAQGFNEMLRDRGFEERRKRLKGSKNAQYVFIGVELA